MKLFLIYPLLISCLLGGCKDPGKEGGANPEGGGEHGGEKGEANQKPGEKTHQWDWHGPDGDIESGEERDGKVKNQAQEGMIYIPGGEYQMGNAAGLPAEQPVHEVGVQAFWIDAHPVTVSQYREFVEATNYITSAEKFGDGGVFDYETKKWELVNGADWRHPRGPGNPPAERNHPVTQVSWDDAQAYCAWAGKRLPHEVEWEYAARHGGKLQTRYSWGDSLEKSGKWNANTWNGHFPYENTQADGYLYTSPVGAYGPDEWGLMDIGGNVWEWCANWKVPYPGGEISAEDAQKPPERAQRGGSFLCHSSYCHGFRPTARSGSTPETSLFHVGFRCVKDVKKEN